ncbi:MAG TPA: endonuclease domain-containing protein [Bacteroidia bacterium]|jgi:very-short-patch-repair endonuclease|nr:endonuclease domain-containing protein [Bacteroidia bacterium]
MKNIERPIYYDASLEIIRRAATLRKNTTEAEKALWARISKKQLSGMHFRRQHPIGKFIVDFYCHEKLLVIELDGEIHNREDIAERDEGREYELRKKGLKILRFKNEQVTNDINYVLAEIQKSIS